MEGQASIPSRLRKERTGKMKLIQMPEDEAVTYLDELGQFSQLDLVIAFFGSRPEFNLLDMYLALFFALIVQLLFLLKLELPIIH